MSFTQGWESPPTEGTHQGQFATDWAKAGNVTFPVYAAREGDATCGNFSDGFGNRVDVTRSDGKVDRYAHLPSCPFSSVHLEQGSFVSMSGKTGCDVPPNPCPIHLHFEVFSSGGTSIRHNLSQFTNWDDVRVHRTDDEGNAYHHHHPAVADSAGPGVDVSNVFGAIFMWQRYKDVGHFSCGGPLQAWKCMGSSMAVLDSTPKARRLSYAGEWGWHQDFQSVSSGFGWVNITWPEACNIAYWMPQAFWTAWGSQANTLGQARSNPVFKALALGLPQNNSWYQFFRHGFIYSTSLGGPVTVVTGDDTSSCLG